MTQCFIEILTFLKFGMVEIVKTLHTVLDVKTEYSSDKILEETILFLFMIYSVIKFKVSSSVPKSFHGPLCVM